MPRHGDQHARHDIKAVRARDVYVEVFPPGSGRCGGSCCSAGAADALGLLARGGNC